MGADGRSRSSQVRRRNKDKKQKESRSPSSSSASDRGKRKRSHPRRSKSPSARELLDQVKASCGKMDEANALLSNTAKDLKETLGARVDKIESTLDTHASQLGDLEKRLCDALQRLSVLEGSAEDIQRDASQLSERMARAEVQPPRPLPNPSFDRDPDPTRLKANGTSTFSKADLENVVKQLLEQDGQSHAIATVLGNKNTGTKFSVQFGGVGQIPVDAAARFMRFLKNEDRTWKKITVPVPGGNPQRLYFGPDVSPRQERIEMLTNRLANILRDKVENRELVYARKSEGVVTYDFEPLISVSVPDPDTTTLRWNAPLLKSLRLDKDDIASKFKGGARASTKVEWSS